ncbi:MAG: hypothetical protein ACLP8S_28030 [Solirubrobacteraceae bacterium]
MTHTRHRLGFLLVVIAALASGGYALASTRPAADRYAPSVACGASSGLASVRGIVPADVQRVYLIYPNGASVQANVTRDAYVFIVPPAVQVGGWPAQLRYTQDNGTAHAIELPSGAFARCLATPQTRPATIAAQPPTARRAVRAHFRLFSIPQAASVTDSIESDAPFAHIIDGRLEPSVASFGFDLADAREVRSDVSGIKGSGAKLLAVPGIRQSAGKTCILVLVPIRAGRGVAPSAVGTFAAGSTCAPNAAFNSEGILLILGGGPRGELLGLAPDGVTRATIRMSNGIRFSVAVTHNSYVVPELARTGLLHTVSLS